MIIYQAVFKNTETPRHRGLFSFVMSSVVETSYVTLNMRYVRPLDYARGDKAHSEVLLNSVSPRLCVHITKS